MINTWQLEERLLLGPILGRLFLKNLRHSGLEEEWVRFGPSLTQFVRVFLPPPGVPRRDTAVFFLHGGGWHSGSPYFYRFAGDFFARLGFPTLLGGYRLAPFYRFPLQVEDVVAGLQAALLALEARQVSLKQVVVGGQSAGGQLAALTAFDPDWSLWQKKQAVRLAGFFSISGVLSFQHCTRPALLRMIQEYLGRPNRWDVADPLLRLGRNLDLPSIIIHGDRDPLVDYECALAFAARLARNPACPVQMVTAHNWHHADLAALFVDDLPSARSLQQWLLEIDSLTA